MSASPGVRDHHIRQGYGHAVAEQPGVLWVVRAGEGARFAGEFLAGSHIAVGFRAAAAENLATLDEGTVRQRGVDGATRAAASQLAAFGYRMQPGDLVITPRLPGSRDYLVGRVGAYEHHPEDPASGPHRRAVTWLGAIDRDELSPEAMNTLGAIQTVFRPAAVEAELRNLVTGLRPVDRTSPTTGAPEPVALPQAADPPRPTSSGRGLARAQLDVSVDERGRATIACDHPALTMEQTPRDVDPVGDWAGVPGVYVLTGTELQQSATRTGRERTLTTTLIVRPWAYVGLSEDFRGRLSSHRSSKPEWRRALLVRSAAKPFSSDDIRYLERAVHQALADTDEVMLDQSTPRGNLSAQPRNPDLLDACAGVVVAVLRLTGTLI